MSASRAARGRQAAHAPALPSVTRRAGAAVVGAALILAALAVLAHRQDVSHARALLAAEGSSVVALEREFLARELRAVRSDLRFLAQQPPLERFVSGDDAARRLLEREYAGFARTKPLYDQIRLLDRDGQELIRVNRRGEHVEVVARDDLQSKADRYYVREARGLATGEVFVSPLDLNEERGAIERPPTPVIRLVTPVASRTGAHRGLLVLNYAGAKLLGELREIAGGAPGDLLLVNTDGEYLQAPDPDREWGWLLGHSASFRQDHPGAWASIRQVERTQILADDSLFTAARVSLSDDADQSGSRNAIIVISRIPIGDAGSSAPSTDRILLLVGTFLGVVAVAVVWARATVGRRVHELRLAESEGRLRTLSSRLLAAQEEERRHLSRVLHDELGQRLTAVALDLKAARRATPAPDDDRTLHRAIAETESVLSAVHEIGRRIRPSVLDDLGLAEALDSHVSECSERTGLVVDLQTRGSLDRLSGVVSENVYRIVQEALANVAAHAATDAARVELVVGRDELELTIEDDGRGFDVSSVKAKSRLGLLGMQERAELLGGTFQVEAGPGRGTRVHVRLPLRERPATVSPRAIE